MSCTPEMPRQLYTNENLLDIMLRRVKSSSSKRKHTRSSSLQSKDNSLHDSSVDGTSSVNRRQLRGIYSYFTNDESFPLSIDNVVVKKEVKEEKMEVVKEENVQVKEEEVVIESNQESSHPIPNEQFLSLIYSVNINEEQDINSFEAEWKKSEDRINNKKMIYQHMISPVKKKNINFRSKEQIPLEPDEDLKIHHSGGNNSIIHNRYSNVNIPGIQNYKRDNLDIQNKYIDLNILKLQNEDELVDVVEEPQLVQPIPIHTETFEIDNGDVKLINEISDYGSVSNDDMFHHAKICSAMNSEQKKFMSNILSSGKKVKIVICIQEV